ncbi:hypothetical protein ACKKBG_A28055 [Auxenochlorella protothecoides x Auxenochlorella symbiontica]
MRTKFVIVAGATIFLLCQGVLLYSVRLDGAPSKGVKVGAGTQGRLVQLVTREEGTAARQGPKPRWARRQDPPPPAEVAAGARRLRQAQEAALRRWTRPDATSTTVFPPGHEDGACVGSGPPRIGAFAAVVMVTFDRAEYLARALESMLHVHALDPDNQLRFPLYISQDSDAPGVQEVIEQHLDKLRYLQHREVAPPIPSNKREILAYYRIANHYKFIFQTFFDCFGFARLIILEDDMLLAPDFFPYFLGLGRFMDADPSLYCVSSWNDHGQSKFVRDQHTLHRTDFFPGLGWMTNAGVWTSIREAWPPAYWDDWMRLNSTRQGRQCIRPEVSRTYNFGEHGSSKGQYFRTFLKPVTLASEAIDWASEDLSHLLPDEYATRFEAMLASAPTLAADAAWTSAAGPVRVEYASLQQYRLITGRYRMLREWKDGVPRAAYRGVVRVRNPNGVEVLIAPVPGFDPGAAAASGEGRAQEPGGAMGR